MSRPGDSPNSVLARVLALSGIQATGTTLTMAAPPAADPFRSSVQRERRHTA